MGRLFYEGAQYPPESEIERLSKYYRGKAIFDGKQAEIYERASELLKGTPHEAQLATLFIAVNIMDPLITKPADLMVGESPTYESGEAGDSRTQARLTSIVEENDLNQMIHEVVIGAGYRGDSWLKSYYSNRIDVSETEALGLPAPETKPEPIIESVDAAIVFPELSRGSRKRFKAINIAWVEWVAEPLSTIAATLSGQKSDEVPYLNVERHIPGYITYERYRLTENSIVNGYGYPIQTFTLGERVATGREYDVEETGVPQLLVHHIPYKKTDDDWRGISGIEKLESALAAINDRLVQIDYILWKHSDPTAYGPDLPAEADGSIRFGGKYIPVSKDEHAPGYMVWESQLEAAFKQLDLLLGLVYQMSGTPQWLFGTTLSQDKGGSGTSHTDGTAVQMRLMPILTKVKRVRVHVDKAVRDALWTSMMLENIANEGVDGFESYNPTYPKITWRDGIPRDEKAEAEVFAIRTGGKATVDVRSAIKRMDGVDDRQVDEIISRIVADESFVNGSVFNGGGV